ncbi:hypothetical protein ACEPAF_1112 [Sanghuangporus sanghuang]
MKSFAAVFFGPESANPIDGIVNISMRGKARAAEITDMTEVTPASIAYAAAQVSFTNPSIQIIETIDLPGLLRT